MDEPPFIIPSNYPHFQTFSHLDQQQRSWSIFVPSPKVIVNKLIGELLFFLNHNLGFELVLGLVLLFMNFLCYSILILSRIHFRLMKQAKIIFSMYTSVL